MSAPPSPDRDMSSCVRLLSTSETMDDMTVDDMVPNMPVGS